MHDYASSRSLRAWLVGGAAVAALTAGVQSKACAQAAAPVTEIGTITVTAQRRSENIQNVPVSVQAISSKEIQALGIKETEDLQQITPNVQIVNNSGAGNQPIVTIRGIGLNDFDTNNAGPNGIYVDDVYISAPSAQSFSVFDLSQVQVLKGPQGTLYGRNTSGGAILFTSNKPTNQFTTDLHLEYGNYNTLNLSGAVGGPVTNDLSVRLAGVHNHSDGFMHNTLTNGPASGSDSEALRLQLLYKPTDRLKIAFTSSIGYVHNLPDQYRHIGVFAPGTQGSASPTLCSPAQALAGGCVDMFGYGTPKGFYDGAWSRTQALSNLNLLDMVRLDYALGPVTLTAISSYVHNDHYFPEDSDAGPNNLLRVTYGVKSDTYTQEFRAAQSAANYNWVAGLYYLHENLQQNQPLSLFYNGDTFGGFGIAPGAGAFDGVAQISYDHSKQITDSLAAYGQGDYTYAGFTLTLGGRVTYEDKSFDYSGSTQFQSGGTGNYGPLQDIIVSNQSQAVANFTWRAGLSYHFRKDIMAYASVATGFKSGDFNGSFLSNNTQQALFELQPVKPERVTAYELGAKTSFFDRRLILNAALFYNDYRDEQVFAQVPQILQTAAGPEESITNLLTNAHRAHTEGLEVELTAAPIHGLTIDLQPAFLDTRLDEAGLPGFTGAISLNGNQLANAPHFSFLSVIDYKYDLSDNDGIDFRWTSSYRSHQFFDSTNDPYIQQNGYWLHNLNVVYRSHKGWDAGAYVRNLTGSKYAMTSSDLGSPFGLVEPIVGPPRTYGVELTYHY